MTLRADRNETVLKARALRRSMTLPEGLLWQQLRSRPGDLKFRRQHPIGPYIADFYCAAAKLIIEVDGLAHDGAVRARRDSERDARLNQAGFRVLRLIAREVLQDVGSAVAAIVREARRGLPLHHALHGSPPQDCVSGRNAGQPIRKR